MRTTYMIIAAFLVWTDSIAAKKGAPSVLFKTYSGPSCGKTTNTHHLVKFTVAKGCRTIPAQGSVVDVYNAAATAQNCGVAIYSDTACNGTLIIATEPSFSKECSGATNGEFMSGILTCGADSHLRKVHTKSTFVWGAK